MIDDGGSKLWWVQASIEEDLAVDIPSGVRWVKEGKQLRYERSGERGTNTL